jgi:hypothetical protein
MGATPQFSKKRQRHEAEAKQQLNQQIAIRQKASPTSRTPRWQIERTRLR